MLNIRDEHVQRRQHGGSYLLRQRSPLSRLGRQVIRIVLVVIVNSHTTALPLLGLCGGPGPS